MKSGKPVGSVYRCPVCGAELSLIRPGGGHLAPVCCNRNMELLGKVSTVYHCSVCRCAVMHIVDRGGKLSLLCCNKSMERVTGARSPL